MEIIRYPQQEIWPELCTRPSAGVSGLETQVRNIMEEVRKDGDAALRRLTEQYDHVVIDSIEVTEQEIENASSCTTGAFRDAVHLAAGNIMRFHRSQLRKDRWVTTSPGVRCMLKEVPVRKVGLYVPGGSAPLISTVLMLAVPASVAGCREIILCTPPGKDGTIHPGILYAARYAGVHRIFRVGGAQAIAAMAYGTFTIPRVYKIFGPGNRYVTMAKQLAVTMDVAIDLPAGPSELLIIADETADAAFTAADLLSQAEHGGDSQVILLTTSERLLDAVTRLISEQTAGLPRKEIIMASLEQSRLILMNNIDEMIGFSNLYAPEHLVLNIRHAESYMGKIMNAGSVFIGPWSAQSAGDYATGTNHTLPTNRSALAWSGLTTGSFMKNISVQKLTFRGIGEIGRAVEKLAVEEKMEAHANAIMIRLNRKK